MVNLSPKSVNSSDDCHWPPIFSLQEATMSIITKFWNPLCCNVQSPGPRRIGFSVYTDCHILPALIHCDKWSRQERDLCSCCILLTGYIITNLQQWEVLLQDDAPSTIFRKLETRGAEPHTENNNPVTGRYMGTLSWQLADTWTTIFQKFTNLSVL